MQEIKFLFGLVPGRFDEFDLMIGKMEVEGKRTVKLDMKKNGLPFDDLFHDVFIGV